MSPRVLLPLLTLALLGLGWYGSVAQDARPRSFAGTGRVEALRAAGEGCQATLRLHRVFSTSQNFGEQPGVGSRFGVAVSADDCLALQVAMSQSDPGHVFFILGEAPRNAWRFLTKPRPPAGCSG
ncbi:MAG: hypothetical protein SFU83_01840 [Meiothermus sp.]|nr:hypothetical protein [Meiothermus sp.]